MCQLYAGGTAGVTSVTFTAAGRNEWQLSLPSPLSRARKSQTRQLYHRVEQRMPTVHPVTRSKVSPTPRLSGLCAAFELLPVCGLASAEPAGKNHGNSIAVLYP